MVYLGVTLAIIGVATAPAIQRERGQALVPAIVFLAGAAIIGAALLR